MSYCTSTSELSPLRKAVRAAVAWSNDHDALTALGVVCAWTIALAAII